MARTLVIELPDDLEQQLVSQAEQLNLSLENVVLRSLTATFNRSLPSIQQTLGAYLVITEMLTRIREAMLAGHTATSVAVEPITLHLAQVMKEGGSIQDFQLVDNQNEQRLLIHLTAQSLIDKPDRPDATKTYPEVSQAFQSLLQNLSSEDPDTKLKAVATLGELYSDAQG